MLKTKSANKLLNIICTLMFLVSILGVYFDATQVKADENSIEFWTTYATEKVLKQQTEFNEGTKLDAYVKVQSCQGEYESAQLMMSAKANIDNVNVVASDLKTADGKTLSKDNVRLEYELYSDVKKNYTGNGAPTGLYPDALVPMPNIVKARENKIKKGENQGVYVTFMVPYEQEAGIYNGNLTVTFDGATKNIPMQLEVYDLKVNRETHSKSKFNMGFSGFLAELDSTLEMQEAYIKKMIEHRVAVSGVMYESHLVGSSEDSMRKYVDKAYEYCIEQGMSNFNIPAILATDPTTNDKTINAQKLTEYIVQVVKKSFETGDNLMKRAIFSTGIIDEPDLFNLMNRIPSVINNFNLAKSNAAAQVSALAASHSVSSEFRQEIVDSIEKFPIVVTMPYNDKVSEYIETWCPLASEYDTPEKRELYAEQEEKWWYTCINPRPPYPGYQIEDTLISARSLSWMMSEYDVVGNLYWAVDVNAKYDGSAYQFIEDYYGEAERYPKANGDGFLFYPGNKYGVFGPLNSIRFEAIRDGNEEYELFYNLINNYNKLGYSDDNIIRNINSLIYTGTKVGTTSEKFYEARKALVELCRLVESEAKVCVIDATDDNMGNITYEVFSKSGYPLMVDGKEVSDKQSVEGGNIYTVTKKRSAAENIINFYVEVDGEKLEFSMNLGGQVSLYDGEKLTSGFAGAGATVTAQKVNGADIGYQQSVVKLGIGEVNDKYQSIKWSNSNLENIIDKNTSKVILKLFNPSAEEIPFKIYAKYEGDDRNVELLAVTLKPGANEILLTGINSYNWNKLKRVESLYFYFSATNVGHSNAKTVYITDMVSYKL